MGTLGRNEIIIIYFPLSGENCDELPSKIIVLDSCSINDEQVQSTAVTGMCLYNFQILHKLCFLRSHVQILHQFVQKKKIISYADFQQAILV